MQDDDGTKPLDLVLANPACLKKGDSIIFQQFVDASIDKTVDGHRLLRQLRSLPPWLRRHACAAQFVQHALLEQVASPWNTFWIFLNGGFWIALLIVLRLLLENGQNELVLAVYLLASYQLVAQVVSWMMAISLGDQGVFGKIQGVNIGSGATVIGEWTNQGVVAKHKLSEVRPKYITG